ncbi:TldD/PmbA family protein [Chamaesiphon minutus]|uniref:Putative Zn-dependent protease-like protein n=1 Tax=Chamaesiphon minutus (strain ATCC 27169 / PCC 6605) TaxID=1173020 RepID=K9UJE5_CHAP6|nr:metallopeptidase TldD-related protein [Chamaesiphon minutus]AFY94304.1 putative Zn-dependent protease-like protein [Chamaesiphon minutus PCC 6605]
MIDRLEASFDRVLAGLTASLHADEQFTLRLQGEVSQFTRFNHAKVRQTGIVTDGNLQLKLIYQQRSSSVEFPFTGEVEIDLPQAQSALAALRVEVPQLPIDPYLVLPTGTATSHEVHAGHLLPDADVVDSLLPVVENLDFTGLYAGGMVMRGYADSSGQKHWFATESYTLDYSLFTKTGQAVKGTLAGSHWDDAVYQAKIAESKTQLVRLAQPLKTIERGKYRTYLAPAATADLLGMLSWGGISEAALQQGRSCFGALQRGEQSLSSHLTISENFQRGLVPRFNELGEIAPAHLTLIDRGHLANTLVNARTAKEYQKPANGANRSESLRSAEISTGELTADRILATLDTGLYLSNLHYLNWSDRPTGRVTGMTRYACFWVERGEIVAPIANLRFDESLYRCWGDNLMALTNTVEFIPDVDTYGSRQLGGSWVPGLLVDDFTYTL